MRFRPRFSVRTLAIVVTLVCAYFGAWEATKKYGAKHYYYDGLPPAVWSGQEPERRSPIPLLITEDEIMYDSSGRRWRSYYLWLFGPELKVPYEGAW